MSAAADAVLRLLDGRREHRPEVGQVLCIDGRAGTGKSTLAAEVANHRTDAVVVHTDDLCPGWDGLPQVPALLGALLERLAAGKPGTYPRYDWIGGAVAGSVTVEPAALVVIEGLGAGSRRLRPWRTVLAWLETPLAVRRQRALDRDGDVFAPYWDAWAEAEQSYLDAEADRAGADLILRT